MAEETTNSAVNTETTEKQATDTFVPAWKIKADAVKEKLGDNEQVFYESDQYFDCLPVARPKDAPNVFPFTSEEPTGFIAPKMDWTPGNHHWIETASIQQGKDIAVLKNQVKLLKDAGQTASQDNQNITKRVDTMAKKTADYEKLNSQQTGQLLKMVSTVMAKVDAISAQNQAAKPETSSANQTEQANN